MAFSLLIRHNHQLGCTRENNTREGCHRYKLYTTDGAVNCEYRDILQTIPRKHSCWFNDETTYVIKMKFHLFSISDSKYISFYVKVYFISKSETFFSGFFFSSARGEGLHLACLSHTSIHCLKITSQGYWFYKFLKMKLEMYALCMLKHGFITNTKCLILISNFKIFRTFNVVFAC